MASKIAATAAKVPAKAKGHCICSPTEHPGSFRCRLHRAGGMPRSVSCQQFADPHTASSPLLSSGHMPRSTSQQQFARPSGSGILRSASQQQLPCSAGVPRSVSWQDFAQEN
ncbi:hypothetical protein D1007_06418 [Hordeum vulgare]|nr:hypothetical protein D1007_06418 [Hordeum vulgare]